MVLVFFDWVTGGIRRVVYRRLTLKGTTGQVDALIGEIREILQGLRIVLQDVEGDFGTGEREFRIVFHVRCRNLLQAPEVLEAISGCEGVTRAEWSVPG